mmetsp:Transcript_22218/g.56947  ORF Transcript_22218/g.56947 Transcript_22218/m.56947 type:complete len:219 (+) Transcript_22218:298-954(+)
MTKSGAPAYGYKPLVLERLTSADAVGGVLLEQAAHEVGGGGRHGGPVIVVEGHFCVHNVLHNALRGTLVKAVPEAETAANKLVNNHAGGPQIRLNAVVPPVHLRCAIQGSACLLAQRVSVADNLPAAEVDRLQRPLAAGSGAHHEVLWFDVAMRDIPGVALRKDGQKVAGHAGGINLREVERLREIAQVALAAELRNNVSGVAILELTHQSDHARTAL